MGDRHIARVQLGAFFIVFAFWDFSVRLIAPPTSPHLPSEPAFLLRSLKYSTQRIVLTRSDSGNDVFNASGLLGPLASEALANVYLPSTEQTVGKR
jgi:hypothetical protein